MNSFRVFIGLGSNVGDSPGHLSWAVGRLKTILDKVSCSSLYATKPRDYPDQPDFLNQCVSGIPRLSPQETLKTLLDWERERGRQRESTVEKGPRPLDMDILLWGNQKISDPDLTLPHPRITERQFVLVPLLELDPFLIHPVSGIPFFTYLKALDPQGIYYFHL